MNKTAFVRILLVVTAVSIAVTLLSTPALAHHSCDEPDGVVYHSHECIEERANAAQQNGEVNSEATVVKATVSVTPAVMPIVETGRDLSLPIVAAAAITTVPVEDDTNESDAGIIALTIGLGALALVIFGAGFIAFVKQARKAPRKR